MFLYRLFLVTPDLMRTRMLSAHANGKPWLLEPSRNRGSGTTWLAAVFMAGRDQSQSCPVVNALDTKRNERCMGRPRQRLISFGAAFL